MAQRPNILFLLADQHSAHTMSCAGHLVVRTPHMDRLAAAGVQFDNAYCSTPLCMPERVSLLTGRFSHNTGILHNRGYLLDEPTTGLDLPAEQEFYSLLGRLRKELSLTVVAVSHDLLALGGQADELVCINRRMHLHGNPEEVVHSHAIQEAYSCEFDFIAGELAHHSHQSKQGQS